MLQYRAIRVRVERVLSGDMNPYDVALMFADLRFLKQCPPQIRDLPDFAAHRSKREKGHTFDATNELFTSQEPHLLGRLATWQSHSGYNDRGVVSALRSFLILRNIFRANELSDTSTLTKPIALYGLASTHGCILHREGGPLATLAVRASGGVLEIGCTDQMPTQELQIKANLCVFSTSLSIDAAIGRLKTDFPHSDPEITVEVTFDGHLRYLE